MNKLHIGDKVTCINVDSDFGEEMGGLKLNRVYTVITNEWVHERIGKPFIRIVNDLGYHVSLFKSRFHPLNTNIKLSKYLSDG